MICSLCYRQAVGHMRVGGEVMPVCGACGPESERVLGTPDDDRDPDGAAGQVVVTDGGREAALEAWDEAAEESRTLRALGDLRQHHLGDFRRDDGPIPMPDGGVPTDEHGQLESADGFPGTSAADVQVDGVDDLREETMWWCPECEVWVGWKLDRCLEGHEVPEHEWRQADDEVEPRWPATEDHAAGPLVPPRSTREPRGLVERIRGWLPW